MMRFIKDFIKNVKLLQKAILEASKQIDINNRLLRTSIERQNQVILRLDSFIQSQAGYQTAITDFMKFRENVEKEEIKKIAAEKIEREPTAHDLTY